MSARRLLVALTPAELVALRTAALSVPSDDRNRGRAIIALDAAEPITPAELAAFDRCAGQMLDAGDIEDYAGTAEGKRARKARAALDRLARRMARRPGK